MFISDSKYKEIREATKKVFFSGLPTKALRPLPSSFVATFLGGIFLELQKKFFSYWPGPKVPRFRVGV